jgi:aspartate kinase
VTVTIKPLVAKFGGTSLADASRFKAVKKIVEADRARRYVVPSAPGKRSGDDAKVTDLLYDCARRVTKREKFDEPFEKIAARYRAIAEDLKLRLDLGPELDEIRARIARGASADWVASRGEYLSGRLLAEYLGFEFVDAAEAIRMDARGGWDPEKTRAAVRERVLKHERAVVPGFYGTGPDGEVKVFSRGGSDLSGSLVADGVGAGVYENWTDVPGILAADPRVVTEPRPIERLTYAELRELSYMGATVMHEEAVFPLMRSGISLNIRDTGRPEAPGTLIVPNNQPQTGDSPHMVTGIAGRKDFTVLAMEKARMNAELGFGRRALSVIEGEGVSYEHTPTGIDSFSIVVLQSQLEGKLERVVGGLKKECAPDRLDVFPDMALIAVVGRDIRNRPGVAARVCGALAAKGINIRMIDQGASGINIILGVDSKDFETSVRSLYADLLA